MWLSAANLLEGRVEVLRSGGVNTEVELRLDGGERLLVIVTSVSAAELGLVAGKQVVAAVPASAIILASGRRELPPSRNHWPVRVESIEGSGVNTTVAMRLPGGTELRAVVTRAAVAALSLAGGGVARAIVPAGQVVLALPTRRDNPPERRL